ncbi:polysaccharide biosynthesis protein [Paucihalobacter ruber]|uniref:Polysaccharide biosynthesis protein n=1 Tax=Paucihalobacter ruber TaxID=2567861 RepID=A0A506PJ04_9FLAO|nr:nucleoside-diphosphate sugar epimerase/dehydratase [Paucihalobacter ruber]TPV33355.1 polysaccharide biosynthesis protein [Paucihalobacter ruber]
MIKRFLNKIFKKYASKWLVMLVDLIIVAVCFFIAYLIRFNFKLEFDFNILIKQIPYVIVMAFLSFLAVGSHKGVVRYTGVRDVVNIVIGTNILATILITITYIARKYDQNSLLNIPGSIVYIHLLLNILNLIGFKFFIKSIYNNIFSNTVNFNNALIYGAGDAGMITYQVLTSDLQSNTIVVGFIDDNEKKIGKKIDLLTVYSRDSITESFIKKHKIDEIIISIQNITPIRLLEISSSFFKVGVKVKIVPAVKTWIDGDLSAGQIKDVKIEDLLGREPISITNNAVIEEYSNQIILITGAAGSIGSEIARKLTQYDYKHLILLDNSESALYNLEQEFKNNGHTNFMPIVADIRDYKRLEQLFNEFKPKIVFHAAAYKHVPLMESNPYEAINVNVIGTRNLALLSVKYAVQKFIMISTDKAVNPTNVMGATKRVAELIINTLPEKGQTKFITTRFGNVLGSNGSVIPLFKKQIELGGPITVTHPEITRYFMTIAEACSLVLEAGAMGNGGEIFVFDMGQSIKIYDLALNMIILSGLRFPEDVGIKITGLRPGEKIYEELLADGENTKPTYHEKIMIAKTKPLNFDEITHNLNLLLDIKSNMKNIEIVALLKNLVPEFKSNNSYYEILDN